MQALAGAQQLLRQRLQPLLATLQPVLYVDVAFALEGEGKLLSQPQTDAHPSNQESPPLPAGVWPLLTLLVAQHITPDIDTVSASSVAVAVECFVCAIDLLDDVMDEDQTPTLQTLGVARTLNVSTALLFLAELSILELSQQGVAPTLILRLLNTLRESALGVTTGQHRDVLAEQKPARDFTREECLEIAAAKAGSIMRLACRLGAVCAGADNMVCEQFSGLGELLGIAHQLDNDSHDLYYLLQGSTSTVASTGAGTPARKRKTDVVRGKKTLPVVLAAKSESTLQDKALSADEERKEYLRALHEGILATWSICLLYRERARACLHEIEMATKPAPALRVLLGLETHPT